jgi:hypothetical protein
MDRFPACAYPHEAEAPKNNVASQIHGTLKLSSQNQVLDNAVEHDEEKRREIPARASRK